MSVSERARRAEEYGDQQIPGTKAEHVLRDHSLTMILEATSSYG